jgi:signal transduction histidine kinase
MKHSIRLKITLLFTSLIILTIFLTWFINRTFLADYYQRNKTGTLKKVYQEIQTIYEDSEEEVFLSEEDTLKLEKISSTNNVNIYVYMRFANGWHFNYPEPKDLGERGQIQIELQIRDYLSPDGSKDTSKEYIEETDQYLIFKLYDKVLDSYYIDLIGTLGMDKVIFLRSNFDSIQESTKIANRFLAYIGGIMIAIGITATLIISKRFTQPILQLANIAKRMSDLDFEVKYQGKTKDEVGVLGNSINVLSDKLEKTVSELKRANNELLTDLQKKTEIDEMRKEFLSNVSHELKTPISLIQGYAEGLMENINEDEESRNFYCEVIMDEAGKMNNMVKKLLSLNELESGSNRVSFERFDIVALIRSVLDNTEILFRQKDVKLRFHETEAVYVWADEYLVEQVVTNYISNALNHVSGAKIIEIKLIHCGDLLRIAVFNTGENIPEDELEKIWIKFYKVDKARTREYGGSGIGLSIVKAIMNSLNRECGVINHPNGVEFWFELDTRNSG